VLPAIVELSTDRVPATVKIAPPAAVDDGLAALRLVRDERAVADVDIGEVPEDRATEACAAAAGVAAVAGERAALTAPLTEYLEPEATATPEATVATLAIFSAAAAGPEAAVATVAAAEAGPDARAPAAAAVRARASVTGIEVRRAGPAATAAAGAGDRRTVAIAAEREQRFSSGTAARVSGRLVRAGCHAATTTAAPEVVVAGPAVAAVAAGSSPTTAGEIAMPTVTG